LKEFSQQRKKVSENFPELIRTISTISSVVTTFTLATTVFDCTVYHRYRAKAESCVANVYLGKIGNNLCNARARTADVDGAGLKKPLSVMWKR